MPREGYPPEVISGFSWGGRQERGQARAKSEKVPIRAPLPSLLPTSPRSGLRAREGTAGAVCPDKPIRRGHGQGAGRGEMSHGVSPLWGSLSSPSPRAQPRMWGNPQRGTPRRTCLITEGGALVTSSPRTPLGCSGSEVWTVWWASQKNIC